MNGKIDVSQHPLKFVMSLADEYGPDMVLSFSRYRYHARSRLDKRESFSVPAIDVTADWLEFQLLGLEPGEELALESRVQFGRTKKHIPMLDFRGMTKGQLLAIMEVFPQNFVRGVDVYFSGRSFHAYFPKLLSHPNWVKFMGSALLCNTPSDPSVIDQRWIGHRLIGGYSALRWSRNSEHYKQFPMKIDPSLLDASFQEKLLQLR